MNITFRQMRLFLALADTGSVSAAARALHVTQPTASMQLREVSASVGLPLYEVIGRKVFLTDAGRELAQTARAIAGEWDRFGQRASAMKGLTSGRLSVGGELWQDSARGLFVPPHQRALGYVFQEASLFDHLSVQDNGIGIDPRHIPRLTERFYRVDSHRSRAMGGTGLGLAIVKHIVQRHRGRLVIESEIGNGSKFSILLPMA